MKTITIPKIAAITISTAILAATWAQAQEETIRGKLTVKDDGKHVFMTISVKNPVSMVNDFGEKVTTKELQIAGLQERAWNQAMDLNGQLVEAKGKLMPAHSPYHKTPILFLTDKVKKFTEK